METDWNELLKLAEGEKARRIKRRKHEKFFPDEGPLRRELYPKHMAFFAAGAVYKERAMIAANRVGKTVAGGLEMTFHLIGEYPTWWEGRRFEEPVDCIAAGDTRLTTRDIIQKELIGDYDNPGEGLIPGDNIVSLAPAPGIPKAASEVFVKHSSGGKSMLSFRSYDQGRKAFQGTARHACWCDEEPPQDVYSEMLTRTMTTRGIMIGTFTPLSGLSEVVLQFLENGESPTGMGLELEDFIDESDAPSETFAPAGLGIRDFYAEDDE